jgi:hypothetical protein
MSGISSLADVPPFPPEYRDSGLLLHVTSLPSSYGVGDLGSSAFSWIDRLHDAGQRWWQALPLGPTGYGNSPYQPMSASEASIGLFAQQVGADLALPRPSHKDCRGSRMSDGSKIDCGLMSTQEERHAD